MKPVLRAVLAAVLGSLVVSLLVLSTSATAAPTTRSRATTKPATVFGVSYGERLSRMSQKRLDATLDDAQRLGIRWIRMDFSWTTIQAAGPSSYDWSGTDRVVKGARARGLRVLPILTWTPAWARDAGCVRFSCPPHRAGRFATFAKAAVQRYKSRGVHHWEVWNEPNLSIFWPSPDPQRYATLLRVTFRGIRSVDPRAVVLLGGLSALENRPPSIGPRQFLTAVCKARGCGSMSAVSYHPYTYPYLAGQDSSTSAWSKINHTSWSLRSILNRWGYRHKRVWVTEYGAPTKGLGLGTDGTQVLPGTDHVSEAYQAIVATDVVTQAVRNADVTALFWYTDRDLADTSLRESSFGLRRLDGSRKPAWLAWRTAVAAAPVASRG
ncbi:cellulase family glycosylhydrolase [Nocardioides marmoribigeumensis]|uniref:Arabinogalactan endo-1,4-beta-galactosidase n=1 Tax=Nocardioides marmoribigeumensis TaxID=433649 RepID=A0ABU2BVJ0_9ACTN|nr:cellulase family glycosylhydrolase [Nocardioides marmoribigeumensis]MDR7362024.1 arabinogalactan endo-1,4-beta-galactosidase [Nocardioides marmoribigeumensis]